MGIDAGCRPWRRIGWDGIVFQVPDHWQPGRIGRRHLFFNDPNGAVLEIKWSLPGSNQTAERIVGQLTGQRRGAVSACPLPSEWKKVLAGRPAAGFAWAGPDARTRGVACRLACGTWTLVQFLGTQGPQDSATLLASLDDHVDAAGRLWSLYDVAARLPPAFELTRWDFAAGAFRMDFGAKGRQLTLYRLAPANVILKTTDLNALAAKLLPGAAAAKVDRQVGEWLLSDPGPGRWLTRLLGKAPVVQRLRLRHLPEANRILGICLKGAGDIGAEMDALCQAYDCLPH